MAIVAIGVAFVTGVAQLAIGLVVGILGARCRGPDQGSRD
jgi:hypothetical protein